jgi:hypothetical protein
MKFLVKFLPKEYQALLTLGARIIDSFDSKEDAMRFFSVVADTLKDGKMTAPEWSKIGSAAGVFKVKK